jgi:hypothetical protein
MDDMVDMDYREFRKLYPYIVVAHDLNADEIRVLAHDLNAIDLNVMYGMLHDLGRQVHGDLTMKEVVEFGRQHSHVLLPLAGAVGQKVLDALVERVKTWLATRPEDRTVQILGPDDEVVGIVKTGKKIQTSSAKDSEDSRR